ncbi:Iron-sulfur cluster assembly scaffold protein IscU [Trichinella pseudospiralis]
MAASEAAMLIGQFCCATVSPPTALDSSRQDVGIAECDSNSAAPHPASSNAALFVIIVSPASPILFNLFRCSVKTEETIYYLNLQLPNVVCLAGLLPGTIVHQMEES